jgi:hypothetical protein
LKTAKLHPLQTLDSFQKWRLNMKGLMKFFQFSRPRVEALLRCLRWLLIAALELFSAANGQVPMTTLEVYDVLGRYPHESVSREWAAKLGAVDSVVQVEAVGLTYYHSGVAMAVYNGEIASVNFELNRFHAHLPFGFDSTTRFADVQAVFPTVMGMGPTHFMYGYDAVVEGHFDNAGLLSSVAFHLPKGYCYTRWNHFKGIDRSYMASKPNESVEGYLARVADFEDRLEYSLKENGRLVAEEMAQSKIEHPVPIVQYGYQLGAYDSETKAFPITLGDGHRRVVFVRSNKMKFFEQHLGEADLKITCMGDENDCRKRHDTFEAIVIGKMSFPIGPNTAIGKAGRDDAVHFID